MISHTGVYPSLSVGRHAGAWGGGYSTRVAHGRGSRFGVNGPPRTEMRLWCGKIQGWFHDFRDRNPSRAPRAEAARGLRAPGQTVATSATLPPSDVTRRGGAGTSRAGSDGRDKRDPPAVGRHAPRRRGDFARRAGRSRQARPSRHRTPASPRHRPLYRARCAADQIERRGVAVKEASATGPVVLTVMRRFARSGNAERNGAARRPSGEKASKPTRSR